MAQRRSALLMELARVGARSRYEALQAEAAALLATFPELRSASSVRGRRKLQGAAGAVGAKTRRRKISAAGRKRISEAQKKRWAALRAEKK